jgi:hypothetical protein
MTRGGVYQKFEVPHLLRKLGMTGRIIIVLPVLFIFKKKYSKKKIPLRPKKKS